MALALTLRKDEVLCIGPDIRIRYVKLGTGQARIIIHAPQDLRISRIDLDEHAEDSRFIPGTLARKPQTQT